MLGVQGSELARTSMTRSTKVLVFVTLLSLKRQRPGTTVRTPPSTIPLLLLTKFQNFVTREEGQDLVEYALLVALIALASITGVQAVASAVTTVFSNISSSLA